MKVRVCGATLENFGPFDRLEYGLADLGLLLVEGRNLDDPRSPSNGAGKSTLYLDAPTWAAFGEAREGIAADDVINESAGRNCAVTLRVEVPGEGPATIQRFRKVGGRNGLRLWIGAWVADLADAKDEARRPFEVSTLDQDVTQAKIEKLLGLDLRVWRAAVYRAQDDEKRFATLTDAKQKEVLSRVFQLDVIDEWRDAASARAGELDRKRAELTQRLDTLRAERVDERLSELQAARRDWESAKEARLAELDAAIDQLTQAWHDAHRRTERLRECQRQLQTLLAQPPPDPPLEAEPPRPADPPLPALPPEPAQPLRSPAQVSRPPAPTPPAPMPDSGEWDTASRLAAHHERAVSGTEERIRLVTTRADQLSAKADHVRTRREGTCGECGAQLSPEHAEAEAARLLSEAEALRLEAAREREVMGEEARQAEELRRRADLLRVEAVREGQAREAQYRAEVRAWEEVCRQNEQAAQAEAARIAEEDRARYTTERARWEAQVAELRRNWDVQRDRCWREYTAACEAVAGRNAESVARARGDYDSRLAALQGEVASLVAAPAELSRATSEGQSRRRQRDAMAASSWILADRLSAVEDRARNIAAELAEVEASLSQVEADLRLAAWWVDGFGPKGLKSFVLDERVQELTDRANAWLQVLTAGVYWVRFETQATTQKGKVVEKFSTRVFRHRPGGGVAERRWGQWSGGQKARVGLGIDFALADAVAARARRSYDLIVLDEVFKHLDAGGRESVLDALAVLRRGRSSVVVTDHDPQFRAAFDRRVVVEMRGEKSQLLG